MEIEPDLPVQRVNAAGALAARILSRRHATVGRWKYIVIDDPHNGCEIRAFCGPTMRSISWRDRA
jgi:hypothetical protein